MLGKGSLKTGVRIADDVLSGQSIKRQPNDANAGKNLCNGLLTPRMSPRKSKKRAPVKKRITTVVRQRKGPTYSTMAFVHRQS